MDTNDRERPSAHGKMLGQLLSCLEAIGRYEAPPGMPEMCSTCAFREGSMTNQMAATGLTALKCVVGTDRDRFACHHGMQDGQPKKLCAGYIAAMLVSHTVKGQAVEAYQKDIDEHVSAKPFDQVRADFDEWIAKLDPDNKLDDYARAREYEKRK